NAPSRKACSTRPRNSACCLPARTCAKERPRSWKSARRVSAIAERKAMHPTHTEAPRARRQRLLALLADGDVDAALQAGLMDYPADPGDAADAPLRQAQLRLREAWAARERYRARQQRLARIAAARDAQRRAQATPAPTPATGTGAAPAPAALPP